MADQTTPTADLAPSERMARAIAVRAREEDNVYLAGHDVAVLLAEYDRRGAIETRTVKQVEHVLAYVPGPDPDDQGEAWHERVVAELERLRACVAELGGEIERLGAFQEAAHVSICNAHSKTVDLVTSEDGASPGWAEAARRWINAYFEQRFEHLATLRPNWDSYGAQPPSAVALVKAREITVWLAGEPLICPTPEGGVQLTWPAAEERLEIVVEESGAVGVTVDGVEFGPVPDGSAS